MDEVEAGGGEWGARGGKENKCASEATQIHSPKHFLVCAMLNFTSSVENSALGGWSKNQHNGTTRKKGVKLPRALQTPDSYMTPVWKRQIQTSSVYFSKVWVEFSTKNVEMQPNQT